MVLKPKRENSEPLYPSASAYNSHIRKVLACLAVAGAGTALTDVAAGDTAKEVKTEEVKKDDGGTPEEAKKLALEKIRKEVKDNAGKLGSEDFKIRRDATTRLIAIGNVTEKGEIKPGVRQKDLKPYRQLVIDEMKTLADHKDPEVKERAAVIIKALTPKPVRVEMPNPAGGLRVEPRQIQR